MSNSGNNIELRIRNLLVPPNIFRTRSQRKMYLEWAHRRVEQLRNLQRRARTRRRVPKPPSPHRARGSTRSESARTRPITMHPQGSGSNNVQRRMLESEGRNLLRLLHLADLYIMSRQRRRS